MCGDYTFLEVAWSDLKVCEREESENWGSNQVVDLFGWITVCIDVVPVEDCCGRNR